MSYVVFYTLVIHNYSLYLLFRRFIETIYGFMFITFTKASVCAIKNDIRHKMMMILCESTARCIIVLKSALLEVLGRFFQKVTVGVALSSGKCARNIVYVPKMFIFQKPSISLRIISVILMTVCHHTYSYLLYILPFKGSFVRDL